MPCSIRLSYRSQKLPRNPSSSQDLPVLTVGETEGFLDAGGVMNFVYGETRQFDLNNAAESRAHLKARSNLAPLARRLVNTPAAKNRRTVQSLAALPLVAGSVYLAKAEPGYLRGVS